MGRVRTVDAGVWASSADVVELTERVTRALALTDAMARAVLQAGAPGTFALDLLEHEIQHHGQLIRYFYALGLEFPKEFSDRYALG